MLDSRSFSIGVDRFLQQISPHRRTTTSFPRDLDPSEARRSPGETLHAWFQGLVDRFCEGDERRVALEENLAVFARFVWSREGWLEYANIQTLHVPCTLDEYYLAGSAEAVYLRLDFDYQTLGDPFSHPLVHIHLDGDLPRFSLDGGDSGNIIMDFLECVYRTYYPAAWFKWVQREWAHNFCKFATGDSIDPLPRIAEAFASSNFQELRPHATDIARIKKLLRSRKDAIFEHHMDGLDRIILEYPPAR